LREYEADPRPKVYITVAGRSNALSGFVDGAVCTPVIPRVRRQATRLAAPIFFRRCECPRRIAARRRA